MIPNNVLTNEVIESAARCLVEVRGRPHEKAWTLERTTFAGSIVSFKVEFWVSREVRVVPAADVEILSTIPIPPPPQPWWADPAAEMPECLPSNVVSFVPRWAMPAHAAGGRA